VAAAPEARALARKRGGAERARRAVRGPPEVRAAGDERGRGARGDAGSLPALRGGEGEVGAEPHEAEGGCGLEARDARARDDEAAHEGDVRALRGYELRVSARDVARILVLLVRVEGLENGGDREAVQGGEARGGREACGVPEAEPRGVGDEPREKAVRARRVDRTPRLLEEREDDLRAAGARGVHEERRVPREVAVRVVVHDDEILQSLPEGAELDARRGVDDHDAPEARGVREGDQGRVELQEKASPGRGDARGGRQFAAEGALEGDRTPHAVGVRVRMEEEEVAAVLGKRGEAGLRGSVHARSYAGPPYGPFAPRRPTVGRRPTFRAPYIVSNDPSEPVGGPLLDKITLDREAFKALASDTRLDILKSLDQRQKTVTELSRELDLNKATVFEHLEKLTQVELVQKLEDERKWVYYQLTWKGRRILHPEKITIALLLSTSAGAVVAAATSLWLWWRGSRVASQDDFGDAGSKERAADAGIAAQPMAESAPAMPVEDLVRDPALLAAGLLLVAAAAALTAVSLYVWRRKLARERAAAA